MTGFRKFASMVAITICTVATGCGNTTTHTPTELHDQKGEHLNYPAGGPNSPDYKKSAGKAASSENPKESAPAEKK